MYGKHRSSAASTVGAKMPESQEQTKIWMRFEKIDQDGKVRKLIIRNLPVSMTENCMALFKKYFIPEEPMVQAVLKKVKDENEIMDFWTKFVIPQGNSVVCVEDNDEPLETKEVFGLNFLLHVKKDDPPMPFPKDNPLMVLLAAIGKNINVFKTCDCSEFMTAFGLSVNGKYRGMKLGQHLLEAREPLCRELGIKVTETIFSGKGAQIIAGRLGYKPLFEMKFSELSKLAHVDIDKKFDGLMVMAKNID